MDYSQMNLAQLREIAKNIGLKGISALKKQELTDLLTTKEKKQSVATAKETPEVSKKQENSRATGNNSGKSELLQNKTKENDIQRKSNASVISATPTNVSVTNSQVKTQNMGTQERVPQRPPIPHNSQNRQPLQNAARTGQQTRPQNPQNSERSAQPQKTPIRQNPQNSDRMQQQPQRPQAMQNPQNSDRMQQQPQRPQAVQNPQMNSETAAASAPVEINPDSGEVKTGIFELIETFGFIRCDNFLPGDNDVHVNYSLVRKYGLRTGDIITGNLKSRAATPVTEKYRPLYNVHSINGVAPELIMNRPKFENLTPVFPNERIHLETKNCSLSMRMVDLISPIGKGQRGMIVAQPKAGKTTLLKQIAKAITENHPKMHLIVLLIDERPEEVTDMKESIAGEHVQVIYSTFDEEPQHHTRVAEMVIEHAKRLVEQKEDVVILLDSITRLARAYNLTVLPSGRTLSGGLDPSALYMPKRFFGAARNMREGGSLTILATALVETGSRMDDVVYEEFKGTGNMELQLDRSLSERRVFPAIDLFKSSTRREDLLLTEEEQEAVNIMRRMFANSKQEDAMENIMRLFTTTKNNQEFIEMIKKIQNNR